MTTLLRLCYSLLLFLAIPLIFLRLLWRGFTQRGYWQNVSERWGIFPRFNGGRCIWIHAVSVGEMRATQPLVKLLQSKYPDRPLLLSCMTATGREIARELYGERATCIYLPYDLLFLQRRLIAHFHPQVLLVMETEIWPNLLAACRMDRVPAMLINARLSERSFQGYMRFAPVRVLVRAALESLGVSAQFPSDADRLALLGAPGPVVTGNIKFDVQIDAALVSRGQEWRAKLASSKQVLLAASTREGEDALLLAAFTRCLTPEERAHILLVMVPRHPQRFDSVFQLIESTGLVAARRSSVLAHNDTQVWLGDSMGEMASYIAMCDVAFIGGSLLPLGGQNLIEACAQGKPVVMGPSTFNFSDASRLAVQAGAMQQCEDADAVMMAARQLLQDAPLYAKASTAALRFAGEHAGATQKTMGLIAPLLDGKN